MHGAGSTGESRARSRAAREAVRWMGPVEGVEGVVLFGSAATGHAHEGSDVDLAVFGTDRGCHVAGTALRSAMYEAGYECDVVALTPGNRYGERGRWGAVGWCIARTGRALDEGGKAAMVKQRQEAGAAQITPEAVGMRQKKVLGRTATAAKRWAEYLQAVGAGKTDPFEEMEQAAEAGAMAGELLVKAALLYRGLDAVHEHDVGKAVEAAEAEALESAVLPGAGMGAQALEAVRTMAAEVNGHTKDDRVLAYTGSAGVGDHGRIEGRLWAVLRHVREEHGRLLEAEGMETLEETCAGRMADVREAVAALPSYSPDQHAEQAAWAATARTGTRKKEASKEQERA